MVITFQQWFGTAMLNQRAQVFSSTSDMVHTVST
jgi:hypothetical protein